MKSLCKPLLTFYFLTIFYTAFSQRDSTEFIDMQLTEKRFGLLAGYNFWHFHYMEVGASYSYLSVLDRAYPYAWATFVSSEIFINKTPIFGFKAGGWISGTAAGLAVGANAIYYTDFDEGSFQLRPEVGFGVGPIKIVYGYNFPITNKDFGRTNSHNISLTFLIPLKRSSSFEIE